MANFKMRANICTYFKNADPLVSSARNIDILSGSNSSGNELIQGNAAIPHMMLIRIHLMTGSILFFRLLFQSLAKLRK